MTPDGLAALDPIFAECLRVGGPMGMGFSRPGGFPGLIRIIFEQQLSTQVADGVWARFTALSADAVTPDAVLRTDETTLRGCGLSRQKIAYAKGLAAAVAEGRFDFDRLDSADDAVASQMLLSLKGVGRWTADLYLLAALRRPDIWPIGDLAIQVGVQRLKGWSERPTPETLISTAEPWRPHRSLAARLVWHYYAASRRAKATPTPA